MYGPVGQGGAAILATAFLLLLPYLVIFPAAQVFFLLRGSRPASAPPRRVAGDRAAAEDPVAR
jgi:hypothetical protein